MKNIDLGQAIQTIANLGVIAGIAFLAIEIHQNQLELEEANSINRAVALREAQQDFSHFRSLIAQDESLTEIWFRGLEDENLDEMDMLRFDVLCTEWIMALLATYGHFVALDLQQAALGQIGVFWSLASRSSIFFECWDRTRVAIDEMGYKSFIEDVENARP